MSQLRTAPADGLPRLASTPSQFAEAAELLTSGEGPFAIDTERASAYRYDDRAFLIQIRRQGAGTVLLDPEGGREALTRALAPVVGGADWIIHAAPSDLPCLAWLGLHPGTIFDTELAARLTGFEHPNLGSMVEELLGVELEKGYGDADWSARPIPEEQLNYAALDVELLIELAEVLTDILAEDDKLDWAYEEFAHIVDEHAGITGPPQPVWLDLRGVGTLSTPAQLNAARALWTHRDRMARAKDVAPGTILPNKVLVEIARQVPRSEPALRKIKSFPRRRAGASQMWFTVLETAMRTDPKTWPKRSRERHAVPSKATWSHDYSDLWELYQDIREDIDILAEQLVMQPATIIRTADVRHVLWLACGPADHPGKLGSTLKRPDQIPDALRSRGAREWQVELVAPLIARKAFR